ncbi:MAG: HAD-IIB family hydrolase [Thiotrichales bacterium]|nr:HAD-IIB family hydrolase [Thiotrichales bacterium]
MLKSKQIVIFTDLDGTVLNHHDYSYEAVLPLLETLKNNRIPVVLNSSKTIAELEIWQNRLGLETPMIAENGGVIRYKNQYGLQTKLIGMPYQDIRSTLKHLRKVNGWQFEGFGDWTVAEVMNHTQLNSSDAVLAKERQVTEPILWHDSETNLQTFQTVLAVVGLQLKKGGRFYHVMAKHDKADAMCYLKHNLDILNLQGEVTMLALGDGGNDKSMLEFADIAIVMPAACGESLIIEGAIYAENEAPNGWVESIQAALRTPLGNGVLYPLSR